MLSAYRNRFLRLRAGLEPAARKWFRALIVPGGAAPGRCRVVGHANRMWVSATTYDGWQPVAEFVARPSKPCFYGQDARVTLPCDTFATSSWPRERRDAHAENAAMTTFDQRGLTPSERGVAWSRVRAIASTAREVLFPPICVSCGEPNIASDGSLCTECDRAIGKERASPACPRCGATVAPFEVDSEGCSQCRKASSRLGGVARVGPYRSRIGQLLRDYKYSGHEELTPLLSEWLVEAIKAAAWHTGIEAVVGVPTHWRRRLLRAFHPAEALARFAARRLGLRTAAVLKRIRSGPHQVGLSFTARHENVHGAFALRRGVKLSGARILVIDDGRTSGATLHECAGVLRDGGASEVYAAVIARVQHAGARDALLPDI